VTPIGDTGNRLGLLLAPLVKRESAPYNYLLMSDIERGREGTGLVAEEAAPKLKRPPLYQVVLINDDYTPMEFVVDILQRFFAMDRTKATRVMLEVHTKGKGVCGVFTYEIAETKVAQVIAYARQHQHPLMATLEEA
jgi:ATP-dependent Clp protease adaptor protein ClpS